MRGRLALLSGRRILGTFAGLRGKIAIAELGTEAAMARGTAIMVAAAVMALSIGAALAADEATRRNPGSFDIAQTSMGGPERLTTPPPRPMQQNPASPPSEPPLGVVAPLRNPPDPERSPQSGTSQQAWWGAVGFTADGSYSTVWKMATRAEAEAEVAKRCARFGRGGCETVSFSGQQCVGLATFIGRHGRKRWKLSFTAGGETYPDAQRNAMSRCNADERTQGRCQNRTVACADGR